MFFNFRKVCAHSDTDSIAPSKILSIFPDQIVRLEISLAAYESARQVRESVRLHIIEFSIRQ